MELDLLTAISPIDGRYELTDALACLFLRIRTDKIPCTGLGMEYFITLCELPLPQLKGVNKDVFETLNVAVIFRSDAGRIKDISVTNHDVDC